jgi:hypothetical protein
MTQLSAGEYDVLPNGVHLSLHPLSFDIVRPARRIERRTL